MNKNINDKPILTIITLTRDSSIYIAECMNSLKEALSNCDKSKVVHLVIDGNSKDDTLSIIKNIIPNSIIVQQKPNGIYNAINYAVNNFVTTPYLTFLHSDDSYDKNYLNIMLGKLKNNSKNPSILVGSVEFIDAQSKKLYKRFPPFFSSFIQKYNNLIFHPNAIYPTELEKRFPYDEKIGRSADHDHINKLMLICNYKRIKSANYKFRISNISTTYSGGIKNPIQHKLFSRIYIHFFETNLLKRFFMKIRNRSYWS